MPSSAKLACVAPSMVADVWPLARALIKRAPDRTGLSDFDRTEREVLAGLQLLWIAHDGERIEAAAVTKLVVRGDRRVCIIAACGGDNRKRWVPLLAGIEDYARAEGCSAVSFTGRRGWQRVLDGYALKFVIMEKGLS